MPNSPNITPKCLHIANEARSFSIRAMHIQCLVHLSLINSPLFFPCFFLFPSRNPNRATKNKNPTSDLMICKTYTKKTTNKNNSNISPTNQAHPKQQHLQPTNNQKNPQKRKMVDHFPENNQLPTWIVPGSDRINGEDGTVGDFTQIYPHNSHNQNMFHLPSSNLT